MNFFIYFPELICIAGLLLWFFLSEKYGKGIEAGRLMFFAGLLAICLRGWPRA
jgi:hypothetical protein